VGGPYARLHAMNGFVGISVKRPETRQEHVERVCSDLKEACGVLVVGWAVLTEKD